MTTEEFLRAAVAYTTGHGHSRPKRVRIYLEDGEQIQLLVSPLWVAVVGKPQPKVQDSLPTHTVKDAIFQALFNRGKRLIGKALVSAVHEDCPDCWEPGTIANAASEMAREGTRVRLCKVDPKDGLGAGYGCADWHTDSPSHNEAQI